MKRLFFLMATLLPIASYSQNWRVNLFGGFANYQGDLQGKNLTLGQSGVAMGAGVSYSLNTHFALRGGLMYGVAGAKDQNNSSILLQQRNLSFKTRIVEGSLMLEYTLLDMKYKRLSPYVFGGIGVYHFNPYTYDTLNNKILLKPLSTEGQGLAEYPDRKNYSLTQFNIPFGAGLKLKVSDNVTIAYEVGVRKLFTDYFDDVSTSYVDAATLGANRGTKAVEMAFRGGELKTGATYPAAGSQRGGSKYDDWYYFHGINVSIGLNNFYNGRKNKLGCPRVD